jgi:hypothetical protein
VSRVARRSSIIRTTSALLLALAVLLLPALPSDGAPVRAMAHGSDDATGRPAWRADPIAAARAIADDLRRRGRLDGAVTFAIDTTATRSVATVTHDFAADRCTVRISPALLEGSVYETFLHFRFLILHEVAHCALYREPGRLFAHIGLGAADARRLDDFVILDAIDQDVPRERPDFFAAAHETYADLRAAAILLEDGVDRQALAWVANLRDDAWADVDHASAPALRALFAAHAADPDAFRGARLESAVRALTGDHLLVQLIGPRLVPGPTFPLALDALVRSRMGSAYGRLRHGLLVPEESVASAAQLPTALAAYPVLARFFAQAARAPVLPTRAAFVDAWIADLYDDGGVGPASGGGNAAAAAVVARIAALRGHASAVVSSPQWPTARSSGRARPPAAGV